MRESHWESEWRRRMVCGEGGREITTPEVATRGERAKSSTTETVAREPSPPAAPSRAKACCAKNFSQKSIAAGTRTLCSFWTRPSPRTFKRPCKRCFGAEGFLQNDVR